MTCVESGEIKTGILEVKTDEKSEMVNHFLHWNFDTRKGDLKEWNDWENTLIRISSQNSSAKM